jgi:organic radical activating enzyme
MIQAQTIKDTLCFKTWNDLTIHLPDQYLYWCCKTVLSDVQINPTKFDVDTLSLDFITNNAVIKQRKQELTNGIRSKECKECWDAEDRSGNSFRTTYYDNDFSNKTEFELLDKAKLDLTKKIELILTNKCNTACVYCWEGLSSRWQKETGVHFNDTEERTLEKVIEVLIEYWHKELYKHSDVSISLLGGEPFFTNHMFYFIENFSNKIKSNNITIDITTNLNYSKTVIDRFFNAIDDTVRYNLILSIESIEDKFEYIRWGSDWKKWDLNFDYIIKKCMEHQNVTLSIGSAHNSLSLPYICEFLNYIESKNICFPIQMSANWVEYPYHMSIHTLETKHKEALSNAIELVSNMKTKIIRKREYISLLQSIKDSIGSKSNENHIIAFERLEKSRNISFSSVFPHFSELIKTYN